MPEESVCVLCVSVFVCACACQLLCNGMFQSRVSLWEREREGVGSRWSDGHTVLLSVMRPDGGGGWARGGGYDITALASRWPVMGELGNPEPLAATPGLI